ncbi:hypothetical protein NEUTE1DRAFT_18592, partial [Neurospora tetrasperma FGSC 2508]
MYRATTTKISCKYDKAAQLQLMAEVYQYALFTIVAAARNDAQAGISITNKSIQQRAPISIPNTGTTTTRRMER